LIKKHFEMGNSRNRARKTRRNFPIERENEARERTRLAMDRMRHGPEISTDPPTDLSTVDDITTSSSTPQVKRLHPMDPAQIPATTQSPIDILSTSNVEAIQDIGIMRDAKAFGVEEMIDLQPVQEDHNHVKHTPIIDEHVIEAPQKREYGTSCPPSVPGMTSARKRTPRRIHVDESCLSGLEGKLPKHTIDWQCSKILREYFESKGDAGKCQLLLSLLKSNCLVVVRRILGIKMVRSSEANNHIVRNLQSAFNAIGKRSRTKDLCAPHHVLSESFVSKSTWQRRLLSHTSHILKLNRKTIKKYSVIRENLETPGGKDCWAFIGRFPRRDMKLIDAVKGLVQNFWHDHTRPSSNQRDVLKLRKGSTEREPHIKHFLDTT